MVFGILQIVVFLVLLALIAKPLGTYMAHVYNGERTFLHPVLRPVERLIYRVCAVDEDREMGWPPTRSRCSSSTSSCCCSCMPCCGCRGCCRSTRRTSRAWAAGLAFNTAVSFVTNTNWQAYVRRDLGELPHADARR